MFRLSIILATALLGPISSASAEFVYEFGLSNYNVVPGGTVDVDVFLAQDAPIGSDLVDLSVDGLSAAGVRVVFNGTPPIDPAAVLSIADIFPDDAFDNTFTPADINLVSGESAGFADSVDFFSPPVLGPRIRLGSFRFTAGGIIGEVTNLRAERFDLANDSTVAGDFAGTPLDIFSGPGFATITVTAVPEPSSLAVIAVTGAGLFLRRRKTSRKP